MDGVGNFGTVSFLGVSSMRCGIDKRRRRLLHQYVHPTRCDSRKNEGFLIVAGCFPCRAAVCSFCSVPRQHVQPCGRCVVHQLPVRQGYAWRLRKHDGIGLPE